MMKDGLGELGDLLMKEAVSHQDHSSDEKRAEEISIDTFIKQVLPEATGMELLFKGTHLGNLVSLTAPVNAEAKPLFVWDNNFAFSYVGNVADSIKERVKKAGGRVEGAALRVSLAWFNYDDLDLHVYEPGYTNGGKGHIFFHNKVGALGGMLDVDMNAGSGKTREAVENVAWKTVKDGCYQVIVNNYTKREDSDVGFVIEVECAGKLSQFHYSKAVRNSEFVPVIRIHMKAGAIAKLEISEGISTNVASQEKWGIKTETYIKVNALTYSPNYWGTNAVGNKHTIFVLDGCKNDEPTRGIYNEFLHARLQEHRKVFEMIAEKTKCEPTEGQVSGLGFSSTKQEFAIVRVKQGKKERLYSVRVGA